MKPEHRNDFNDYPTSARARFARIILDSRRLGSKSRPREVANPRIDQDGAALLESGLHDAYVIGAEWETTGEISLRLDIAITQGPHRGELVTISVPAATVDGAITPDFRAVCSHFSLDPPESVPDGDLEIAILAMPCTLAADGPRLGFATSRKFDERETGLDD